jgi:hypothetical protein
LIIASRFVMLRARFGGDDAGDLVHEFCVPCRGQTDRLRKDGRVTGSRDAVQGFVPPLVLRDAEPLDRRRGILHLQDFLFERHARDEIVDARLDREARVQVRRLSLRLTKRQHCYYCCDQDERR